jgi:thioredoxin 1
MHMAKAKPVDEAAWRREVLEAGVPVLVEVTASWLEPCRLFTQVVDDVADDFDDRLKVLRLVVDCAWLIARHYDVTSVPTLRVFCDGAGVGRIVGTRGKPRLLEEISAYLA